MSDESEGKAHSGGTPAHAEQKAKAAPVYVDWGERFHGADSSILGTTLIKACCQCGIELNHRTRFKDTQGRYWCPECNAVDHARHLPAPCEDCRTAFPRDQMTEDNGKFVCEECLGKRVEGSVQLADAPKAELLSNVPPGIRAGSAEISMRQLVGAMVVLSVVLAAVAYFLL